MNIKQHAAADRIAGTETPMLNKLHAALIERSATRRICDMIEGTDAGQRLQVRDVMSILDALQCAFYERGAAGMDVACALADCWTEISEMDGEDAIP